MRRWLGAMALAGMSACVVFNPQTDYIQRTYFASPPPPVTTTDWPTPAFAKKRGFTKHVELMAFLTGLAEKHPDVVTLDSLGASQRGRDIPVVRVTGANPAIRVFFLGGLHGNEPAGSEGLLLLLHRLLENPELREVRDAVDLMVVPVANPDGYERQVRAAANGLDMNRDQTKLKIPESRLLKRAFHDFNPHVAVDFHEYRSYRRDFAWFGEQGVTNAYDVMFLYSGNHNVPEALRTLTHDVFVQAARDELDRRGLRHHDYVTTRNVHGDIHFNQGSVQSRSSATHFALNNAVSMLVEVRGVALGRHAFERRVLSTAWVAERVMRTAVESSDVVLQVLGQTQGLPKQVTVTHEPGIERGQLSFIDLAEYRMVDLDVTIRNNLESEASLTRARPEAYAVLPDAAAELIDEIELLGLDATMVPLPRRVMGERFLVTDVTRSPHRYEGQRTQDVEVEVQPGEIELPQGSYVVRLDQPGANIALEVFEPEAPNSFVSFGVLRARPSQLLPIVRIVAPTPPLSKP